MYVCVRTAGASPPTMRPETISSKYPEKSVACIHQRADTCAFIGNRRRNALPRIPTRHGRDIAPILGVNPCLRIHSNWPFRYVNDFAKKRAISGVLREFWPKRVPIEQSLGTSLECPQQILLVDGQMPVINL
jgi:hypothetical protein